MTNYPADRAAVRQVLRDFPEVPAMALANRAFLGRAVRFLAAEAGIRQFIDIGTGIPSAGNVHEIAGRAAPDTRVVYVDNDPIVHVHANALLTGSGATGIVLADAADAGDVVGVAGQCPVVGELGRRDAVPFSHLGGAGQPAARAAGGVQDSHQAVSWPGVSQELVVVLSADAMSTSRSGQLAARVAPSTQLSA